MTNCFPSVSTGFGGLQGAEERKTEKYFCLHIVEMKRYDFILTQTGEPILSAINNNLFRSQTFDCMTGRGMEMRGEDDRIELISFLFCSFIIFFLLNYKRVISRLLNALIFFCCLYSDIVPRISLSLSPRNPIGNPSNIRGW